MKHVALAALLAITATTTHAQQAPKTFSITPRVGVSFGSLTGDPSLSTHMISVSTTDDVYEFDIDPNGHIPSPSMSVSTSKESSKTCLTAGLEAQYQFGNVLGLIVGANYRHTGIKYHNLILSEPISPTPFPYMTSATNRQWSADFLDVPVMLNVYLWKGLAVKAGLQMNWLMHESAEASVEYTPKEGFMTFTGSRLDVELHKISFSVPVGLSYEYRNIVVDARYSLGLTNLTKGTWDGGDAPSHRTSSLTFTLGYKFTL